uniref:CHCH domain-containing protein n=1 Tax=Strongyloides venezuelensis TaxID=75913 RepID=A0A0K0EUA5_STRVS
MFLSFPIFKESALARYAGRSLYPKKRFFQEILPLASTNHVRQSKEKPEGEMCMKELQSLFNCLKKWEFDDLNCTTQQDKYTRCVKDNAKRVEEFKKNVKRGALGQGGNSLTISQINKLMELFPQPGLGRYPYKKMQRLPTQDYDDDLFGRKNKPGKAS